MEEPEQKRDEDAEIDFSRVTNLFKRKKTSAGDVKDNNVIAESAEKKSGSDDEIDIGKAIAGIKGIFKKAKESGGNNASGEESVDVRSALSFISKHYITMLVILGILVSVGLGFSIRMQSGNLSFTDGWARNSIEATIGSDVSSFVSQTYPNLPDRNRQLLITEELDKARANGAYTFKTGQYAGQTINIGEQVSLMSDQFKTF